MAFLPEGETKEVANLLHRGIGPALKRVDATTSTLSQSSGAAAGAPSSSEDDNSFVTAVDGANFKRVRHAFGISEVNFWASVVLQAGRAESDMKCIPTKEASGKSKAYFFFSPDQRYVFKTCTAADLKTLCRILPRYVQHVEANAQTLLPRYVALFSIVGGPTFVCMTNVFGGQYKVHQRYDLKGSTYGRTASAKELAKKSPVLKDGDFVNKGVKLAFRNDLPMSERGVASSQSTSGPAAADTVTSPDDVTADVADDDAADATPRGRSSQSGPAGDEGGAGTRRGHDPFSLTEARHFVRAIETDAFFLASVRLIDYSLLVGVHERLPDLQYGRPERTPGLVVLDNGEVIMYVCIVDILTPYGARKRAETFFMGTLRCGANISCQPPRKYARRFLAFAIEAAGDDSVSSKAARKSLSDQRRLNRNSTQDV